MAGDDKPLPLPSEVYALAERWTVTATALGFAPPMTAEWALIFAATVMRLNTEVAWAERAKEAAEAQLAYERQQRAIAEGELADMAAITQSIVAAPVPASNADALIDAIEIAEAAGRRGLLTDYERNRLRELRRAVPS